MRDLYLALTEREARLYVDAGALPWPFDVARLLAEYDRRGDELKRVTELYETERAYRTMGGTPLKINHNEWTNQALEPPPPAVDKLAPPSML